MAMLAAVEHIWNSQEVSIDAVQYSEDEIQHNMTTSANLLLNSQCFNQCYTLNLQNIHNYVPLHEYDVVYKVNVLVLVSFELILPPQVVLDLLANRPLHGASNLQAIVLIFRKAPEVTPIVKLLDALRTGFLAASARNPFRLILPHHIKGRLNIKDFRLTNNTTSEVLELRDINVEEAAPYVKGSLISEELTCVLVERSSSLVTERRAVKKAEKN
ncbi:hypothetical protein Ddc_03569 [Ditylenchus destructor]|nr:hypothetical protein Ddc_03569 [Ditylenchus destructor]